jgi:hypothetical protein
MDPTAIDEATTVCRNGGGLGAGVWVAGK